MATTTEASGAAAPILQPLIDFWTRSLEQNTAFAQALWTGSPEAYDFAGLRRRWLDAIAESLDAYMRTPAFLELMRQRFQALTECKSQGEDLAQELAREAGIPRMPDISGLFERIQTGQKAIRSRLGAIERRLDALEGQRPKRSARGHNPGEQEAP
jgi:hypothetical protein